MFKQIPGKYQQLGQAVVKLIVFKHSSCLGVSVLSSLFEKTFSSHIQKEILRRLHLP